MCLPGTPYSLETCVCTNGLEGCPTVRGRNIQQTLADYCDRWVSQREDLVAAPDLSKEAEQAHGGDRRLTRRRRGTRR